MICEWFSGLNRGVGIFQIMLELIGDLNILGVAIGPQSFVSLLQIFFL